MCLAAAHSRILGYPETGLALVLVSEAFSDEPPQNAGKCSKVIFVGQLLPPEMLSPNSDCPSPFRALRNLKVTRKLQNPSLFSPIFSACTSPMTPRERPVRPITTRTADLFEFGQARVQRPSPLRAAFRILKVMRRLQNKSSSSPMFSSRTVPTTSEKRPVPPVTTRVVER